MTKRLAADAALAPLLARERAVDAISPSPPPCSARLALRMDDRRRVARRAPRVAPPSPAVGHQHARSQRLEELLRTSRWRPRRVDHRWSAATGRRSGGARPPPPGGRRRPTPASLPTAEAARSGGDVSSRAPTCRLTRRAARGGATLLVDLPQPRVLGAQRGSSNSRRRAASSLRRQQRRTRRATASSAAAPRATSARSCVRQRACVVGDGGASCSSAAVVRRGGRPMRFAARATWPSPPWASPRLAPRRLRRRS